MAISKESRSRAFNKIIMKKQWISDKKTQFQKKYILIGQFKFKQFNKNKIFLFFKIISIFLCMYWLHFCFTVWMVMGLVLTIWVQFFLLYNFRCSSFGKKHRFFINVRIMNFYLMMNDGGGCDGDVDDNI